MNVADLIIGILHKEGVEYLPAFPHSDLIDAAARYQIECLGGDYADLARSLGGHCERVSDPADIVPALKRALLQNADGVPALIECITSEEKRFARKLPAGL